MKKRLACNKCGYTWAPHRGVNPKECPKCKSYEWDSQPTRVVVIALECKHCGHSWVTRGDSEPKVCPKCKSYSWNKDIVPKAPKICLDCLCFNSVCTRGKTGPDGRNKCDGFMKVHEYIKQGQSTGQLESGLPDF